ncbi:carbon-nitrogen hydrolase family protein [Sneathiella limimaris]|uniref:carbon-nitrogen hydrolase family protein n=1 Tax=Sneathiella limimaris TaxID=1964213 RepID=UPI00146B7F91|nr:carbon-nitrogen hydrolase family protein [Sneathiella limimaris]
MTTFKAACIQMTSGKDPEANLKTALGLMEQAAAAGADFISTPEVTNMMEPHKASAREKAYLQEDDPTLAAFCEFAKTHQKWIHAGSLVIKKPDDDRLANRALLISPDGQVQASYDKIHMFDVELDNGESHKESSAYAPGEKAVSTPLPWGQLGLAICYDVRFAHLFQTLSTKGGAEIFTLPAAFTYQTGKAHWHTLLRARAIENGCFVIAAAQCGQHTEKRRTFGHSLIIDPWGEVLADGGEEPGFIIADIDMSQVAKRRGQVPNLKNIRPFDLEVNPGAKKAAE